jgi:hypothetical protein
MTLSARFSLLHSDLNDFLFAPVGDQQNGMPLNVMSALIRLDIDPWKEAKRLVDLLRKIGEFPYVAPKRVAKASALLARPRWRTKSWTKHFDS